MKLATLFFSLVILTSGFAVADAAKDAYEKSKREGTHDGFAMAKVYVDKDNGHAGSAAILDAARFRCDEAHDRLPVQINAALKDSVYSGHANDKVYLVAFSEAYLGEALKSKKYLENYKSVLVGNTPVMCSAVGYDDGTSSKDTSADIESDGEITPTVKNALREMSGVILNHQTPPENTSAQGVP